MNTGWCGLPAGKFGKTIPMPVSGGGVLLNTNSLLNEPEGSVILR